MSECRCPVVWYSWGVQVEHTKDCPVYQARHPVLTWLRKHHLVQP